LIFLSFEILLGGQLPILHQRFQLQYVLRRFDNLLPLDLKLTIRIALGERRLLLLVIYLPLLPFVVSALILLQEVVLCAFFLKLEFFWQKLSLLSIIF